MILASSDPSFFVLGDFAIDVHREIVSAAGKSIFLNKVTHSDTHSLGE